MNKDRIGYQGIFGSYSSIVAKFLYPDAALYGFETFDDVFRSLADGNIDFAVIPIENSTAGRVSDVHRIILNNNIFSLHP